MTAPSPLHAMTVIGLLSMVSARQPNIILFLADDFGYGDLSVYGHPSQEAGPVDKMAAEGLRFTQFYSVASFCSPSRASLLTGRYALRSGMDGDAWVNLPCHRGGLPHSETTLAETLKAVGYTTGIVGKWHLGINAHSHDDGSYLPNTQGFDYVGHILPHTLVWDCDTWKRHKSKPRCTQCFLYENRTVIEQPIRVDHLTSRLLHDAQAFIHDNVQRPFFLYFPFPQTHTPMFNKEQFRGKSRRGVYGDQVNEMSWAVGEVLGLVDQLGLAEDTLAIFSSDHGPHREMCEEGGSTGTFRGGKGNFYEGGVRIPTIARWPGTIPAGTVSSSVLTLMDLFSTLTEIGRGEIPADRHIDSVSFADLLTNSHLNQSFRDIVFFHCMDRTLTAIRYKQYKIHFYASDPVMQKGLDINCQGTKPKRNSYWSLCTWALPMSPPLIYNLDLDPGEEFPLDVDDYRQVLSEAMVLVDQHKRTLEDLPDPQLELSKCRRRFLPCCNPPYCTCGQTDF